MKRFLPQEGLKLFACLTMLIDHVGAMLVPGAALRAIGRLSFPVFCFLLAEGAYHTRNPKKYALRLLICMVLSELPFDYAFFHRIYWGHQNVMATLLLGFCALWAMKQVDSVWTKLVSAVPMLLIAYFVKPDYGVHGVLLIVMFGLTRNMPFRHLIQFAGMLLIFSDIPSVIIYRFAGIDLTIQMLGALSVIPIALYSGEKKSSSKALQWGFYLFYPLHILVLMAFW